MGYSCYELFNDCVKNVKDEDDYYDLDKFLDNLKNVYRHDKVKDLAILILNACNDSENLLELLSLTLSVLSLGFCILGFIFDFFKIRLCLTVVAGFKICFTQRLHDLKIVWKFAQSFS